ENNVGSDLHFVSVSANEDWSLVQSLIDKARSDDKCILCIHSTNAHRMVSMRRLLIELMHQGVDCPVILQAENKDKTVDEQLIDFATDCGGLLLDGFGDGIWLNNHMDMVQQIKVTGRTYLEVKNSHQFLNNTAFSILQATRTRIS